MGRSQRAKGVRGERAVRDILEAQGIAARRAVQYSGDAGDADVIAEALPDFFIESKNVAVLPCSAWLKKAKDQAGSKVPVIFAHRTHDRHTVVLFEASRLVEIARRIVAAVTPKETT